MREYIVLQCLAHDLGCRAGSVGSGWTHNQEVRDSHDIGTQATRDQDGAAACGHRAPCRGASAQGGVECRFGAVRSGAPHGRRRVAAGRGWRQTEASGRGAAPPPPGRRVQRDRDRPPARTRAQKTTRVCPGHGTQAVSGRRGTRREEAQGAVRPAHAQGSPCGG
ncbi:hypothetical protein NDU88_006607 [Pleurodeles waltl]|uniref:Uncharacterized protein n=1 Tax=Pleurodeles waltl TaxID=8319 RepID=A0AAV7TY39_PLEWA|nr:hypothetical protein NDU88_006607 [Pleurodeles waltl]